MMPSVAVNFAVNGNRMAARVSMLTPGMAPNIMPPRTPAQNKRALVGLLNNVIVPAMKFSIVDKS